MFVQFSLQNISEIEIIDTQLKSARMHSMSRSRSRGEDRVQQLKWQGVTEAQPATWPRPKNLRKNQSTRRLKDHLSQWISDHQGIRSHQKPRFDCTKNYISLSLRMSAAQPVDSQRQIKNINALMNHHHVSLLGDYGVRNQPLPGLCVPF